MTRKEMDRLKLVVQSLAINFKTAIAPRASECYRHQYWGVLTAVKIFGHDVSGLVATWDSNIK